MFRVQRNVHRQLGFEKAPRRQGLQHPLVKREAEKADLNNKQTFDLKSVITVNAYFEFCSTNLLSSVLPPS